MLSEVSKNYRKSLKFSEFNTLLNPNDIPCYVEVENKAPIKGEDLKLLTFKDICKVSMSNPYLEIGWVIPKGYIVIDIEDKDTADILLSIIEEKQEKVLALSTPNGMHLIVKSDFPSRVEENYLTCGARASVYVSGVEKEYIVLPFKNPKVNKSKNLLGRTVLYFGNDILETPYWLEPMYYQNRGDMNDEIKFPHKTGRDEMLKSHAWRLVGCDRINERQRKNIVQLINDKICTNPLTRRQLFDLTESHKARDEFAQGYFRTGRGSFIHHRMAKYIIKSLKVTMAQNGHDLIHYNEEKNIYETNEEYIRGKMQELLEDIKEAELVEALKYIKTNLGMRRKNFNTNPDVITFRNCCVNVKTGEVLPLTPKNYTNIQLEIDYNPHCKAVDVVEEYLNTASCNDPEVRQQILEAVGYGFLMNTSLASAFLLFGNGQNGKSLLFELIEEMAGLDNCAAVDFEEMNGDFGLGGLENKLFSLAGDISGRHMKDTATFKKIVSGDRIVVNRKNEKKYTTRVFATMFFSANKIPGTSDTTNGFRRRFNVIPFEADLSHIDKVTGEAFARKVKQQDALEYLGYLATQAIMNVYQNTGTFLKSKRAKQIEDDYYKNNISSVAWIEFDGRHNILVKWPLKELYDEYKNWALDNGKKRVTSSRFVEEIGQYFGLRLEPKTKYLIPVEGKLSPKITEAG